MSWLVNVRVPLSDADAISSHLWDLGTTGIAEVEPRPDASVGLIAGFAEEADAIAAHSHLLSIGINGPSISPLEPWPTPPPTQVVHEELRINIDAGTAFGHGGHPTTMLALGLLLDHLRPTKPDGGTPAASVLDVGCGTGVLAIAAALRGANPVMAIDIDDAAVEITKANADANGAHVICSTTAVSSLGEQYEVIVANLLLADLRPLAPDIRGTLTSEGAVVLSGFLAEQEQQVHSLFPSLQSVERRVIGDWVGLVMR